MASIGDCITVPVLYGATGNGYGTTRCLGSVNCEPNGITYAYCAAYCCTANDHCGHDVGAHTGERMYAMTSGTVDFAGADGYYCPVHVNIVPSVGTYKDEYHIYGHMQRVAVSKGQHVNRGDYIGTQGDPADCGWCGGNPCPHIHFERRDINGCSADPTPVLTSTNADGGGGGLPPPPDPPVHPSFAFGDIIRASTNANLRATPAGSVTGTVPAGGKFEIKSEFHTAASLSGTTYKWVYGIVQGGSGSGWVATANFAKFRPNRLVNPTFQTDTANVVKYKSPAGVTTGRTGVSRTLGGVLYTDQWLTVATDGSSAYQGVYLKSAALNFAPGTYSQASGRVYVRNVSAGDTVLYCGVRVTYTDGTFTDRWADPPPTSDNAGTSTEESFPIPVFTISSGKTIAGCHFYMFGNRETGDARSWQMNRASTYLR